MEEEPQEHCENCNILLPQSKLDLHEAYCIRFCRKCEHCGHFFHKDELEQHIEEKHKNPQNQEEEEKENELSENNNNNQVLLNNQEEEDQNQLLPTLSQKQESLKLCALTKQQSSRPVEDGKVKCSHCGKQILEEKIDLHENYCYKYCKKCVYCKEYLHEDDMEEHIQQNHVICQYCNKRIDISLKKLHEKVCHKGGRPCRFCEMVVPFQKFEEHESFCGGQTDNCNFCLEFIRKKELKLHDKICVKKNEELKIGACTKYQQFQQEEKQEFESYLKTEIKKFSLNCDISEGKCIYLLDEFGWDFEQAPIYPSLDFQEKNQQEIQELKNAEKLNECIVCLNAFQGNEYFSLECQHRACDECYRQWIQSSLKNGARCLRTRCILEGCDCMVGSEGFETYLDEEGLKKYYGFIWQSALTSSNKYIQCANVQCRAILQLKNQNNNNISIRKQQMNVYCDKCEHFFCNLCGQEPHKPLTCGQFLRFQQEKNAGNEVYKQFQVQKGLSQILQKERVGKLEEGFKEIMMLKIEYVQKEDYFSIYSKCFSVLIEAQQIIQYGKVLKMMNLYPSPIVETWIEEHLQAQKDQMEEKLVGGDRYELDNLSKLRDFYDGLEKLIREILEEFSGDNSNNINNNNNKEEPKSENKKQSEEDYDYDYDDDEGYDYDDYNDDDDQEDDDYNDDDDQEDDDYNYDDDQEDQDDQDNDSSKDNDNDNKSKDNEIDNNNSQEKEGQREEQKENDVKNDDDNKNKENQKQQQQQKDFKDQPREFKFLNKQNNSKQNQQQQQQPPKALDTLEQQDFGQINNNINNFNDVRSDLKCIQCEQNLATTEAQLCDFCFDMLQQFM